MDKAVNDLFADHDKHLFISILVVNTGQHHNWGFLLKSISPGIQQKRLLIDMVNNIGAIQRVLSSTLKNRFLVII